MKFFKSFMTKYLSFFIGGVALFLAVEIGLLVYVNNYYLREKTKFTVSRVKNSVSSATQKYTFDVGDTVQSPTISHDGSYLACLQDGNIIVYDFTTGQKYTVDSVDNREVSAFVWDYDRDRLTIAEKTVKKEKNMYGSYDYFVNLYAYDVDSKKIQIIKDYSTVTDSGSKPKEVECLLNSDSDKVSQIDLSTETVVTYLKITTSGRNRIWEANITNNVDYLDGIKRITSNIGKILCRKDKDVVYYEDNDKGKVYSYTRDDGNNRVNIEADGKQRLLGFDSEDKVYIAVVNGKKAESVYCNEYGSTSWQKVSVGQPTDIDNLYVTFRSGIYQNDPDRCVMTRLSDSRQAAYTGKVVGVYDGGFITISDGKVRQNSFDSKSVSSSLVSAASSKK